MGLITTTNRRILEAVLSTQEDVNQIKQSIETIHTGLVSYKDKVEAEIAELERANSEKAPIHQVDLQPLKEAVSSLTSVASEVEAVTGPPPAGAAQQAPTQPDGTAAPTPPPVAPPETVTTSGPETPPTTPPTTPAP